MYVYARTVVSVQQVKERTERTGYYVASYVGHSSVLFVFEYISFETCVCVPQCGHTFIVTHSFVVRFTFY